MHRPPPNLLAALGLLFAGGIAGGLVHCFQVSIVAVILADPGTFTPSTVVFAMTLFPLVLAIFILPVFLMGMAFVGWPVWSLMNYFGWRSPWLGGVAGGLFAPLTGQIVSDRFALPLADHAWLILPGVVAGSVGWLLIRTNSRPLPPPPPAPPS